jgi:hypothetical protein
MKTRDIYIGFEFKDPTITILNGSTQSATPVNLDGFTLVGFHMPSTFDGTTLTIQTAPTIDGTYNTVQSAGADYTLTTAASKYTPIENLAIVSGLRFIKVTAGTAQSTTDTIITLATRPAL